MISQTAGNSTSKRRAEDIINRNKCSDSRGLSSEKSPEKNHTYSSGRKSLDKTSSIVDTKYVSKSIDIQPRSLSYYQRLRDYKRSLTPYKFNINKHSESLKTSTTDSTNTDYTRKSYPNYKELGRETNPSRDLESIAEKRQFLNSCISFRTGTYIRDPWVPNSCEDYQMMIHHVKNFSQDLLEQRDVSLKRHWRAINHGYHNLLPKTKRSCAPVSRMAEEALLKKKDSQAELKKASLVNPLQKRISVGARVVIKSSPALISRGDSRLIGRKGIVSLIPRVKGSDLYGVLFSGSQVTYTIPAASLQEETKLDHPPNSMEALNACKVKHSKQMHSLIQSQYRELFMLKKKCKYGSDSTLHSQLVETRRNHAKQVQNLKKLQAEELLALGEASI